MIDERQVNLIIQAQLKGGRDLKAITESIAELEKALARQAEAARRGEGSIEDLKAASAALKAVQDELGARNSAVKSFETLTKKISEQSAAVDKAKARVEKYEASLEGTRTEKQQKKVQDLTDTYQRSAAKLDVLRQQVTDLGEALSRSGVNVGQISQELQAIGAASLRGATALNQASQQTREFYDVTRQARDAAQQLAAAQRQAAEDAAAFARGEQRAADAAARRLKAEQEVQEALANRRADSAANDRLNQEQQAANLRQQELAALRRDIEERSRLAAELQKETAEREQQAAALRKSADEAEKTARAYTGLARAAGDIAPRVRSLRESLDEIVNPGRAARATLDGLSSEIDTLANSIAANNGRVDDYRATLAQLSDAQRSLANQAGLIDNFNRQTQAVRNARAEFSTARDQVSQLAAAMRQGGEGADQLARPLAEAQARLRASATALRDQIAAARESRQTLRDAGINTGNLADAQRRLTENTRRLTEVTKQLNAAQKEGTRPAAGGGAASGFQLFNDEGRTTLSLAQRIRGEILAMTAAFVGLYGVIDLARTSLQAYNQQQNLASTLGFAFGGDQALVAQQMEYLRAQADRIGVSYEAASKNFARFSAAAVKSGASVQETNFIFEAFAETGRVIGLTPDELNGIFNAIGQSFSKGKIQAEELRQQIGERLPGAFAFAQEALRKQFPDLNKALEQGQVGAENMVLIAESVRKAAADQLPRAIKSLDAEQQRFNTSVLFFKKEIADAGFADSYIALLKELQSFFRSEEGIAFARGIGQAFAFVIDVFRESIEFVREYSTELKALGIALLLIAGNSMLGAVARSLMAVKAAMATATVAAAGLSAALLGLNVAALGFALGTYLRDQFEMVELAGINLVINLQKAWTNIKFGAMELFASLPELADKAFRKMLDFTMKWTRASLGLFARFASAIGFDSLADGINRTLATLTEGYESTLTTRVADIRAQRQAELAQIEKIGREMMVDAIRRRQTNQAVATPATAAPTAFPGARSGSNNQNNDKAAEQAAKRRENEIEALNKQLDSLDARLDRAQGDNLARQLEAIDTQYRALAKRIAEIGGREAVDLGARWGTLYAEARNAAIEKFNEQRAKAEESLLSKIEQLEAQAGKKQEENLGRRIKAISDGQQALLRDLEAERDILVANGRDTAAIDELIRRAEAGKQALVVAEAEKFNKEELAKREKEINDILTVRKELIDQVKQAQQEGQITDVEAQDRIRAIVEQSQPRIDAVAESARIFAENLRGAVSDTAIDAFIAKLDAARNSGARLTAELNNTQRVIRDGLLNALDAGVGAAVDALSQMAMGTMKVGDAFKAMGRAALSVLAQVVRELAVAAIRASILRAITGGGGGPVSWGGEAFTPAVSHSGGVVGAVANRRRAVSPTWFANAPRYHSGGIVGLRPDEYPAILQRNEEVLSRSDPRNVMNGGLQPAAASSGGSVRVVLVDDPKRAAEQLAGADGEQVVMQHIRSNLPTLRTMLK